MEVTQIYPFQGTVQLNKFIEDNCRDITVEKIEMHLVESQNVFFFFLTVKVRLGMCEVMRQRHATLTKYDK